MIVLLCTLVREIIYHLISHKLLPSLLVWPVVRKAMKQIQAFVKLQLCETIYIAEAATWITAFFSGKLVEVCH